MGLEEEIRAMAADYARQLDRKITERIDEMKDDDTSHFLIYQVLGVSDGEGRLIDEYQNKGRLLYRAAGAFLEDAAKLCFQHQFPEAVSVRIPNTEGRAPKTFEIDCLIDSHAVEIKWRDATTDGDHVTKEHTRLRAISNAGYTPIRVMFFYPNRYQSIRIQQTMETLYKGVNGQYYYGDAAWSYIRSFTGVDLLLIMQRLARANEASNQG